MVRFRFGCIGFELNAGLLSPSNINALIHGPPHSPTCASSTIIPGACNRLEALVQCNRPYTLFLYTYRFPSSPSKNTIIFLDAIGR